MSTAQFHDDRGNYLILDEIRMHRDSMECQVELSSHGFSYRGRQLFDMDSVRDAVAKLESMYETLAGECEIRDCHEENGFRVEINKLGHVNISGVFTLYSEYMNQLRFSYRTDQTVLYGFWQGLARALSGQGES